MARVCSPFSLIDAVNNKMLSEVIIQKSWLGLAFSSTKNSCTLLEEMTT